MKYFIFRNSTVENLFSDFDAIFSGYDDISNFNVVKDTDIYIWFYLVPLKPDENAVINEILSFYDKLALVSRSIPEGKRLIIFTLNDINSTSFLNSDFSLHKAVFDYNHKIYQLSQELINIKILNLDDFLKDFKNEELIDWKYYYLSQSILNPKLAHSFRLWFDKKNNAINSIRKKCLILDLDNTLWGGILGEDGVEGIQLGNTYPGNAYSHFQLLLLQMTKYGVILAVCSKNNQLDVEEAWNNNPFMILKKEHFVATMINWDDKASNIRKLSEILNIGLDSMVFIDDNPSERELVKKMIPQIEVPDFPSKPYLLYQFGQKIYADYFQLYNLTDEDKSKTDQYKKNAERESYKTSFASFDDYLKSLEIKLTYLHADRYLVPRIAQMSQKTNQFNLTTCRYSENDIDEFVLNNHLVVALSVMDKFGDHGITACSVIKIHRGKKSAEIVSFLLSCRILGKKIENAFLYLILNELMLAGISSVNSLYIPSAKNIQTEDFYDNAGFILTGKENNTKNYTMQLKSKLEIDSCFKIDIR
jgi:FkbH-like protein